MRAGSWGGHAMRVRLGCGTGNRQPTRGKVKGLGTTPCWIVQGKARQGRPAARRQWAGGNMRHPFAGGGQAGTTQPTQPTRGRHPPQGRHSAFRRKLRGLVLERLRPVSIIRRLPRSTTVMISKLKAA